MKKASLLNDVCDDSVFDDKNQLIGDLLKSILSEPLYELAMQELCDRVEFQRSPKGVESLLVDGKQVLVMGRPFFTEGEDMMSIRIKVDIPKKVRI